MNAPDLTPVGLWLAMGPLAKAVVVVLAALSILSLAVSAERLLAFARARRQSLAFARLAAGHLAANRPGEIVALAARYPGSHLARVVAAGLGAFTRRGAAGRLTGPAVAEAAARAVERASLLVLADFRRGVGSLATVASTAPFIGLFGTVVGIIHAFNRIAEAGAGGLNVISQGIAEALVTTALGLLVAIPAAWMFNHFTHRLDRMGVELANSTSELLDYFLEAQGEVRTAAA